MIDCPIPKKNWLSFEAAFFGKPILANLYGFSYSLSQSSDVQVLHSPLLPLFPLLLLLCPSLPSPFPARGGQLPQLGGSQYLPKWLRTLIAVDNKIQVQPVLLFQQTPVQSITQLCSTKLTRFSRPAHLLRNRLRQLDGCNRWL